MNSNEELVAAPESTESEAVVAEDATTPEEVVVEDATEVATEDDSDLLEPAPEVTAEHQAEHDASFGDQPEAEVATEDGYGSGYGMQKKEEEEEEEAEDMTQVPWNLLDMCMEHEVAEDARLTAEQRKALPDEAFCGPNRSFPVPDCAHVTAARRLIGRADLTEAQKGKVLSCVSRKAKAMGCDVSDKEECMCNCGKYKKLTMDYATALSQIDELRAQLADAVAAKDATAPVAELDTADSSAQNEVVENVADKQDSSTIELVENVSVASTQDATSDKSLSDYEKKIVNLYTNIRDEQGQFAADRFLVTKMRKRHLPRNFDISQFVSKEN